MVVLAALLISGCALAPGIRLDALHAKPRALFEFPGATAKAQKQPDSGSANGAAEGSNLDTPPAGAITPINPALVSRLRAQPAVDPAMALAPFLVEAQPYRIGPADVISVLVWGQPEFAMSTAGQAAGAGSAAGLYTVDPAGMIQFPYVGMVRLAGLTEAQARQAIVERLERLLKDPQVTVAVQAFRSARVYVDGEVRNPGQKFLDHEPMTLPTALSRAGGLTPAADRSAVLITRGASTVRVNIDALTARGLDPNRLVLAAGDMVRVANFEDEKVYVLGEVLSPGGKPLKKGRLTLHQALGEAVGVSPYSGDPRQVYVVRPTNPLRPEIYHLDVSSPMALALAEGFDLRDRDVVYVDPVPLVRWNRVISLILPSATALNTARSVVGAN